MSPVPLKSATLPAELIALVIEKLIPVHASLAYPANHVITKTLVSLRLTAWVTSDTALRLLVCHCLYVDSCESLAQIVPLLCTIKQRIEIWNVHDKSLHPNQPQLSLYLAPFTQPEDWPRRPPIDPFTETLNRPDVFANVCWLLDELAPFLSRLVIGMPLRHDFRAEDPRGLLLSLADSFRSASSVTECVSVRDELCLYDWLQASMQEKVRWATAWTNLRKLALYNLDLSTEEIGWALQFATSLTHLILTRPDGLTEPRDHPYPAKGRFLTDSLRRIMVVNTPYGHGHEFSITQDDWQRSFLGTTVRDNLIRKRNGAPEIQIVRVDVASCENDEVDDIQACQEWVRDRAVERTLWEWPGAELQVFLHQSTLGVSWSDLKHGYVVVT